jgi:hypothetical protein
VAFSPDGKTILTGSSDHSARLWETANGQPIGEPLLHGDRIRSVAFSPDGRTVLTASFDQTARLWDAATGKPVGPVIAHRDWVVDVAFSPDGRTILTASSDGTARLCAVPPPWEGGADRISLWTQIITGTELGAWDIVRPLGDEELRQRWLRLGALGGPPAPGETVFWGGWESETPARDSLSRAPGNAPGRSTP